MKNLAQAQTTVKPIVIDVPFLFGLEAGKQGASLYDGYNYYCGDKFLSFERGWKLAQLGKAKQAH